MAQTTAFGASSAPPARRLAAAALALALLLVAALATLPLAHDDLFQHLATGERVVTTGRVPTTDFLSHTRAGAPWVSHEWGFSVLAWAVWRVAGLPGLLLLKVLLALALAAAVAALARRLAGKAAGAGSPLAAALAVAAAWAVSRELILRAALAGALLLALFALALLAFRARPGWRRGAAVVALALLWANLHSGVIFGLFLLALFVASAAWRAWRRKSLTEALPWLGLLVACAAASLANPNGVAALLYPVRLARLLGDPASGFTVGHFAGGWAGREGLLGVLVAALLAGWLLVLRRRPAEAEAEAAGDVTRTPAAADRGALTAGLPPAWLAASLLFALLSWRTSRLGIELVVLALPAAYAVWSRWADLRGGWPRTSATWLAGVALATAFVLGAGTIAARPPGVVSRHFPAGAVAFLHQHGVQGHLFNHQNWGGYLYWNLREPVFWDGRNLVFASLVREVTTTPFETVARRYGVGTLVIGPGEVADLRPVLVSGRWRLVYGDAVAAVYVRVEVGGGE